MSYEPKQEMAFGKCVLSERERQAPVQLALQGLCSPLQAEFPGGGGILSLPIPKVWELGFKLKWSRL